MVPLGLGQAASVRVGHAYGARDPVGILRAGWSAFGVTVVFALLSAATMIVVPRKEDQHPDHCASWFFVMDALGDIERVQPDYAPSVVNYIIHWYSWPFEDEGTELTPPPGLRGGASGWIRVPLTRQQQRTKRTALKRYQTQVLMMRWFLYSFARANEIFSRPAPARVVLPLRHNPCGD